MEKTDSDPAVSCRIQPAGDVEQSLKRVWAPQSMGHGRVFRETELQSKREASAMISLAAIAIAIRSIPEVLSYPYLIGNDTVLYAGAIHRTLSCLDVSSFFRPPLLPLILCPLGKMFGPVALMKIYPPVAYGVLALVLYAFARESLGMNRAGGFVCTLLVLMQFGMLRISWDLHRNLLALVFLLLLLNRIQDALSGRQLLLKGALAILIVLTHDLTALLMVAILVFLAATALLNGERSRFWNIVPATVVSVSMLSYTAFSQSQLVSELFTSYAWKDVLASVPVFFGLVFLPLLPSAVLGHRINRVQIAWILVTVAASFSPILSPLALAFWDRWMLMMLPPLGFIAASGVLRVTGLGTRLLQRLVRFPWRGDLAKRIVPVSLLILFLAPSAYLASGFVAYSSDQPFWYFDNPTLWRGGGSGIPSTMLSNTVALRDAPDVICVISQLNRIIGAKDVVLAHEAFYGWLLLYLDDEKRLIWYEHNPVDPAVTSAKAQGFEKIYLLWFVSDSGWHAPDPDLSAFKQVFRSGIIVAYIYVG